VSDLREIVVADIGGTHARFAIAQIADGRIAAIDRIEKLRAADHPSLQTAWEAYRRMQGDALPGEGAFAVAGPVGGDVLYFTNSSWMLRPAQVPQKLGLTRFTLVNDFAAVAHAAAQLPAAAFAHVCGPDSGLPHEGMISVLGPGTGLGVALLLRRGAADYSVIATEGGHIDFAPVDAVEDRILARLRRAHRRVSVERVVAGSGLQTIYRELAEIEQQAPQELDDNALWQLALSGDDPLANAAFDRFCLCLGGAAGDFALAQGAKAVIVAGGLGHRIGERLATSGFRERFMFKGRFQSLMETIPVYRLTHSEPGLYGAAAAFMKEFGS
jgi:glucokinase